MMMLGYYHFAPRWNRNPSSLYTTYLGPGKPINKRVVIPRVQPLSALWRLRHE